MGNNEQPNNLIGIHAGVWIGTWTPESTTYAVDRTVEAGFDLLEITASDVESIDTGLLSSELQRAGLKSTVSMGLAFDADVSSEDALVRARGVKRLETAVELAKAVDARTLAGVLYSALGKYPGPATDASRRNSVAAMRDVAQASRAAGIPVALEVVNRYETNQFNEVYGALKFIDEIGEDNVFVHLDTYHMNIEEAGFRAPIVAAGDRLGYVHIGESHRGYLGSGNVGWAELFRALDEIGYRGDITFESFSSAVVDPALSNTLAVWRNLWDDHVDLARHARQTIAAHIGAARATISG